MTITPSEFAGPGVVAVLSLSNAEGDIERQIPFRPAKVGKNAHLTDHADHQKLLADVIRYFNLPGEVDEWRPPNRPLPAQVGNGQQVRYTCSLKTFGTPIDVWSISIINVLPTSAVWVYNEDDGEFAAQIREERTTKVAETKEAEKTRRAKATGKPATEPKAPREPAAPATVAGFPFATKPKQFELNGKVRDVKVFGKLHREKAEGGKRVEDPNTPRTATDDLFTYKATSYQLGKVSGVYTHAKGIIVDGANGLAILQILRPSHKEEWAAFLEAVKEKGGWSGTPSAIK